MVAARHGQRETYKPLASALCPQPQLPAVIRAYLSVFPFKTFYIADLNAIGNDGNNHALITRILETHSEINLWIDSGADPFIGDNTVRFKDRVNNVIGSETGMTGEQLDYYTRKSDCILSMDYRGGVQLGDPALAAQPARLPQRVIIMSLGRVGSHAGPDLALIRSLAPGLPGKQLYAAGGVRNIEDLRLLAGQDIHGALIASALHDKTITTEHLTGLTETGQDRLFKNVIRRDSG